jgi:hypothetical protein
MVVFCNLLDAEGRTTPAQVAAHLVAPDLVAFLEVQVVKTMALLLLRLAVAAAVAVLLAALAV